MRYKGDNKVDSEATTAIDSEGTTRQLLQSTVRQQQKDRQQPTLTENDGTKVARQPLQCDHRPSCLHHARPLKSVTPAQQDNVDGHLFQRHSLGVDLGFGEISGAFDVTGCKEPRYEGIK